MAPSCRQTSVITPHLYCSDTSVVIKLLTEVDINADTRHNPSLSRQTLRNHPPFCHQWVHVAFRRHKVPHLCEMQHTALWDGEQGNNLFQNSSV